MRRLIVLAVLSGAALLVPAAASPGLATPVRKAAPVNLAANPGFEDARYADHSVVWGWTCDSGASQQGAPHTGARSLTATPTASTTGRCAQTVPVQPGQTYTLSAWVRGGYVFLGHDYGVIWTPPTTAWTLLTTTFTAATAQVQIYVHGWYANSAFQADDVTLAGPSSSVLTPVAPSNVSPAETTSHSVKLSWPGSPGATGYRIYRNGIPVRTVTSTSASLDGLAPATTYLFQVAALNSAGESALSEVVDIRTAQRYDEVPHQVRSVVGTPHAYHAWLAWEAVMTATDGYYIYQDGVRIAWSYGPAFTVTGLQHGTLYTFEVTAVNSAGES